MVRRMSTCDRCWPRQLKIVPHLYIQCPILLLRRHMSLLLIPLLNSLYSYLKLPPPPFPSLILKRLICMIKLHCILPCHLGWLVLKLQLSTGRLLQRQVCPKNSLQAYSFYMCPGHFIALFRFLRVIYRCLLVSTLRLVRHLNCPLLRECLPPFLWLLDQMS